MPIMLCFLAVWLWYLVLWAGLIPWRPNWLKKTFLGLCVGVRRGLSGLKSPFLGLVRAIPALSGGVLQFWAISGNGGLSRAIVGNRGQSWAIVGHSWGNDGQCNLDVGQPMPPFSVFQGLQLPQTNHCSAKCLKYGF